eukprot:3020353-Pleurochrysis_carterae.AAC.1
MARNYTSARILPGTAQRRQMPRDTRFARHAPHRRDVTRRCDPLHAPSPSRGSDATSFLAIHHCRRSARARTRSF